MSGSISLSRKNNDLAYMGYYDFSNMLDDFFRETWLPRRNMLRDTFKLDISEEEAQYIVEAEIPGVKKDDITLFIENDVLCIVVDREEATIADTKEYLHRDRRFLSMSRNVRLDGAQPDKIKATFHDGVLTIIVPKDDKSKKMQTINID